MTPADRPYVNCDCADVPPTMPTCRAEHLYDCPVAAYQRFTAAQADGSMAEAFDESGRAMAAGDTAALAAMASRDVDERAKSAALRARWSGAT